MKPLERWAQIRQAVTDAVLSAPAGIGHHQLTVDMQACDKAITRHLKALQADGIVGYVGGCKFPVWTSAQAAPAMIAAGIEARKVNRRQRRAEQTNRSRARKRAGLPPTPKRAKRNIPGRWAADIDQALLSLPDGATSEEIARRMGRHVQSVKKYLRAAHKAGLCAQERMGKCGAIWCHIDHAARAAELRKAHDDGVYARKLASRRTAERLARGALIEAQCNDFERPPVHLWSDARTAPPIRVTGPNSVWSLAA